MKKSIKLLITFLCVIFGMASCTEKEETASQGQHDTIRSISLTFNAYQNEKEDGTTRAGIDATNSKQINWTEDDAISIFDGSLQNCSFNLTDGAGTKNGKFKGNVFSAASSYVALYPYNKDMTFTDGCINNVKLPDMQTPKAGSFDSNAALMIAKSNGGNLPFKNVAGFVKITCGRDFISAELTSTSSDPIAGIVKIALDEHGNASVTSTQASYSVTLYGDMHKGETYYIALLPCTLNGFTLTFTDTNGTKYQKKTDKTLTITSGKVVNLGEISGTIIDTDFSKPYLTFSADAPQTFKMVAPKSSATKIQLPYYSVGDKPWSSNRLKAGQKITFGGNRGVLRLRGDCIYGTCYLPNSNGLASNRSYRIQFGDSTVMVKCSGDIRTLLNWKDYENVLLENACFAYLFYNCNALVSAPSELSGTRKLAPWIYASMFEGCKNLKNAPILPSNKLAKHCYDKMFQGCSSLYARKLTLPANKLPMGCYSSMFNGIKSISQLYLYASLVETKDEDYHSLVSSDMDLLRARVDSSKCFDSWLRKINNRGVIYVRNNALLGSMQYISTIHNNWKMRVMESVDSNSQ